MDNAGSSQHRWNAQDLEDMAVAATKIRSTAISNYQRENPGADLGAFSKDYDEKLREQRSNETPEEGYRRAMTLLNRGRELRRPAPAQAQAVNNKPYKYRPRQPPPQEFLDEAQTMVDQQLQEHPKRLQPAGPAEPSLNIPPLEPQESGSALPQPPVPSQGRNSGHEGSGPPSQEAQVTSNLDQYRPKRPPPQAMIDQQPQKRFKRLQPAGPAEPSLNIPPLEPQESGSALPQPPVPSQGRDSGHEGSGPPSQSEAQPQPSTDERRATWKAELQRRPRSFWSGLGTRLRDSEGNER